VKGPPPYRLFNMEIATKHLAPTDRPVCRDGANSFTEIIR
jgi:hypothetical protein